MPRLLLSCRYSCLLHLTCPDRTILLRSELACRYSMSPIQLCPCTVHCNMLSGCVHHTAMAWIARPMQMLSIYSVHQPQPCTVLSHPNVHMQCPPWQLSTLTLFVISCLQEVRLCIPAKSSTAAVFTALVPDRYFITAFGVHPSAARWEATLRASVWSGASWPTTQAPPPLLCTVSTSCVWTVESMGQHKGCVAAYMCRTGGHKTVKRWNDGNLWCWEGVLSGQEQK